MAILAGSLVVLSMVKPERLAASTGAMIALFAELLVALAIYDEIAKKPKSWQRHQFNGRYGSRCSDPYVCAEEDF